MLQSIVQYGTGAPTYIYSQSGVTVSNSFFHVFAAEMGKYDSRRERTEVPSTAQKKPRLRVTEEQLQELYQRESRVRGLESWR